MSELFPLVFQNAEVQLLTAVVLGFLFGFSLERGGFGNARKLAGQFYLHDMTVFKVMFTAILVAMVGLYTLVGLGWVDMARLWINPTFMWAQVVGGFVLGMGFIMSGLCPGTSVVSAASGRWDGLVTIAGIFIGTAVFTVAVDLFPALESLYRGGEMGVSVLPELFGLPTLPFVLVIVLVAATAFVGAEAVEDIFSRRHAEVELTPPARPFAKFGVAATLSLVLIVGLGLRPPRAAEAQYRAIAADPIPALTLAERIIAGDPDLMVLDLRGDAEDRIPGAYPVALDSTALPVLAGAGGSTDVVLVDPYGALDYVPAGWPDRPTYRTVVNGWRGWEARVLTPAEPEATTVEELARVRYQRGISAYFSGAAAAPQAVAPPPAIPTDGGGAKPKRGGC
ncbi:MAG: YeeE/YedE thiosulfate transporter family protein [Longimicrobiales bacterium]|nr:YeeE/YedE thiosulfate transporter family protein [Longimicrobiales bacterium]